MFTLKVLLHVPKYIQASEKTTIDKKQNRDLRYAIWLGEFIESIVLFFNFLLKSKFQQSSDKFPEISFQMLRISDQNVAQNKSKPAKSKTGPSICKDLAWQYSTPCYYMNINGWQNQIPFLVGQNNCSFLIDLSLIAHS